MCREVRGGVLFLHDLFPLPFLLLNLHEFIKK